MEFFDLTKPLFAGMPVYPGDPPVSLVAARSHEVDGYAVTQICLGSHSGTHLDAPRHFFPKGATLDEYPVERLIGPGLAVDCSAEGNETAIGAQLLAEKLRPYPFPVGGFVLVRTGGRHLTEEAAQLLLDYEAGMVGSDAESLDEEPYEVHRLLLGQGVLLLENLYGLERLTPGPITCACLPLAVLGTDGAPARVVAWR